MKAGNYHKTNRVDSQYTEDHRYDTEFQVQAACDSEDACIGYVKRDDGKFSVMRPGKYWVSESTSWVSWIKVKDGSTIFIVIAFACALLGPQWLFDGLLEAMCRILKIPTETLSRQPGADANVVVHCWAGLVEKAF